ncbi:hypothetical protein ACHAWF_003168, partial [Thalassiosira exigua]
DVLHVAVVLLEDIGVGLELGVHLCKRRVVRSQREVSAWTFARNETPIGSARPSSHKYTALFSLRSNVPPSKDNDPRPLPNCQLAHFPPDELPSCVP